MSSLDDGAARERIRSSLDESLIVEAAAGTGKTTELVGRLVSVLKKGKAGVEGVVAVTFTRKAAGELKLRLRLELEKARAETTDSEERRHLERAISRLEEARIGTIHSFCADLLRERPVEAGVDPAFAELSEEEGPRLFDRAFKSWIQRKLNQMPESLARALSRIATWKSFRPVSPLERIRDAGWIFAEWRDFAAPWGREDFDRQSEIDALLPDVFALAEKSAKCSYERDYLRMALRPARFFTRDLEKAESTRERDYNDLEARLLNLTSELSRDKRKGRGFFAHGVAREEMVRERENLVQALEHFKRRADADLAAALQDEFQQLVAEYGELKRRVGGLDFVDLLLKARDLVRYNPSVRRDFQKKLTHLFVDEFQDTDPLQSEILLLLAADDPSVSDWRNIRVVPGKLFLVGDPKQSIYRFRRADVLLYQEVKKILTASGVNLLYLQRNFRSVRPLQQAVNAAFEKAMNGDVESGQPDYVPLLEQGPPSTHHPALIALPAPRPYGWFRITRRAVEECLPETVASFVEWLLNESGWKVRNPEDPRQEMDLLPRHVCILFRRFMSYGRDVTRPYIRALDVRSVPHLLVGSRTFHRRDEVGTLRAALTAVEWPDDELSVFATLKGSLFAVADSVLLRFRKEIGPLHPFRRLPEDLDETFLPVSEALGLLADLHRRRNHRPIVRTVNEILDFTRAHAGFALRPAGDQVLANVQRVCDMARRFEIGGGISYRGFVERLEEEAEKVRSVESPVLEEGAEGVRIMTLHAAKGLEFPVVILADMTARLAQAEPDKFVDLERGLCATRVLGCSPLDLKQNAGLEHRRDEAEGIRIAYVAATRARDILVVPAVGDAPLNGWVDPLSPALYPAQRDRRGSQPATGCPDFGETTILAGPSRVPGSQPPSIKPGRHRPQAGGHQVVWWDPAVLNLGAEGHFGLREEEVLSEDKGRKTADQGLQQYLEWKERRAAALDRGGEPEFRVFTASEATALPENLSGSIEAEILERPEQRPSGRRFGTLVHTVLRDVDLAAGATEILSLARYHGRVMQATREEVRAAVDSVKATLRHPLLQRARASNHCHREFPLLLNLEDGRTLEGSIDLTFLEQGRWIVLDFKTDANLDARRTHYERQVQWYVFALSRITGTPAKGYLLAV
ncbi:MAG: UvrD-helicase domain-containing protein [Acidobacteriota bacterium]